ncbi:gfo/Idh/MocA family oxidoreductase, partial [Clostridium perfringens]
MMMEKRKHAIVIVGYGGMGSYHAMLIKDNAFLEVTGTYDILEVGREVS